MHLGVCLAIAMCLLAGWWQATRAMSGNTLSYLYAIEWPAFAVLAIVGWWQLVHDIPLSGTGTPEGSTPLLGRPGLRISTARVSTGPSVPTWDPALESPALKKYNDYLASLSSAGARKTWRDPNGLGK